MRFALVNNERTEAETGLRGFFRGCGMPVIPKCGTVRVHHWAHQNTKICDSWWEPETEWHRSWKNNFTLEWQEVFMQDAQTGEKHMADVGTIHDLVIEFQHSHIDPQEQLIREKFYKNMVWIVDGTRLKFDYPRFVKGQRHFEPTDQKGIFHIASPDKCFPSAWLSSSVPVIFDFKGEGTLDDPLGLRAPLYCLFPIRIGPNAVLTKIPRSAFIKNTTNGEL
jgi:competence protein CoiA